MLPFGESVNQARKSQDFSIKPLESEKDQVVRLKTTRIERRVVWLKSVEKEKYGGQEGRHLVSHLAT